MHLPGTTRAGKLRTSQIRLVKILQNLCVESTPMILTDSYDSLPHELIHIMKKCELLHIDQADLIIMSLQL